MIFVYSIPVSLTMSTKVPPNQKKAKLEPAPVIGPDGKATHLDFEVASWHTVMNELTHKSRRFHEEEIAKLLDTGMTLFQIQNSGYTCQGITLQIGEFWYSLACLYGKSIMSLHLDLVKGMVFSGNVEDVCVTTILFKCV